MNRCIKFKKNFFANAPFDAYDKKKRETADMNEKIKLVIDENSIYEIDLECLKKRKNGEKEKAEEEETEDDSRKREERS